MPFEAPSTSNSKVANAQMFTGPGGDIWTGTAELLSLLNGVAPSTIRELGAAATTIALPPRRVVYKPGDPSKGLYVVLSGRVNLTSPVPESKPRIVALLGPGAWFGETALLLRARRSEPRVRCRTPRMVVRIGSGMCIHMRAPGATGLVCASRRIPQTQSAGEVHRECRAGVHAT